MHEPVTLEVEGRVAFITLRRAHARNALDEALAAALHACVERAAGDARVRCAVIRGSGGHFMAGGDVKFFDASLARLRDAASGACGDFFAAAHGTIRAIRGCDKPFVASVCGSVAGYGLSLMAACDLAVAGDDAHFRLAYRGIGASPDGASTWHLPRLIGLRRALELALLDEVHGAADAAAMGLVNRVVPVAVLDAETRRIAARLAAGPAAAQARAKHLLHGAFERGFEAQLQAEEACFRQSLLSADFAEGVRAFCAKREPRFE